MRHLQIKKKRRSANPFLFSVSQNQIVRLPESVVGLMGCINKFGIRDKTPGTENCMNPDERIEKYNPASLHDR
jgi:hypothetical protein